MSASTPPIAARAASDSRWAVAGWVAFVALFVYALLIGGGWPGIYLVMLRFLSLALVAVVLGAWFVATLRKPGWRPATAIWPTLLLPVLALALSTLTSSLPRLGVEYVAWAILLVALYLLLVRILGTRFARDRIGALAAMLALVIGAVYLGTVVSRWLEWWDLAGAVMMPPLRPLFASYTFGNPSAVLTVEVLLSLVAAAGLGFATRGRRLLLSLVIGVMLAVVVVTGSRGGWLALAGASVIVGGVWLLVALRTGSLSEFVRTGLARRGVRLGLVVLGIAAMALALVVAPAILQRAGAGDGGRPQLYTVAVRIFEDAQLVGTGPGTWVVERLPYTRAGEFDWYIPHAHDVYLQTLAELGIVGMVAGVLALLPVGWLIYRGIRHGGGTTRPWAWAAFFILVYLGLHQVVDFYMNMPAVMLLAAIPVAVLDATSERRIGLPGLAGPTAAAAGRLARASLWTGCLVAVVVLFRTEALASTHQAAMTAIEAADWDAAEAPASQAADADPDMIPYQVTRGMVASAEGDWEAALDAYLRAAEVDDLPQSWLGVAQAQIGLERPVDEVVDSIDHALRIGEQQPAVVVAAGSLYDRLGMIDEADEAYADAIAVFPSLAADPGWTDDPDLDARFGSILERAVELVPPRAWEIALMAGDPVRARQLNEAAGGSVRNELVIGAWGGDQAAVDELLAQADASPRDAGLLSWGTRIAARFGDDERADRYQRLAVFIVTEGGALPGTEVRVDRDGWLRYVPAGTRSRFAGHYLYRRPLGVDLIPPGLPRLVHAPREVTRSGS